TADGVPICTAAGDQSIPRIIADGSGGAVIAWSDPRGASLDIFARRVNSQGTPQWAADGIAVCSATDTQTGPVLVQDGSGGAIIVWQEQYLPLDVYAQRVDANGVLLWNASGVAVATATSEQDYPVACPDGAGGAIIAWHDYRTSATTGSDIYVQRLNSAGVPQWTTDGVALCTAASSQQYAAIVSDGSGGAVVTWEDYRGGIDADVYALRVSSAGVPQWA